MPIIMSNPVKENRCGKFSIGENFLEDEPFLVMRIMSRCIIVEAENRYLTKSIDYHAYSPDFEITEYPQAPPTYDVVVTKDEDGEKIRFVKAEDEYNRSILRKISF